MLRIAEAWEFAAFWYKGIVLTGYHTSKADGVKDLADPQVDFIAFGARPDEGMQLWNITRVGWGSVCGVTNHTLRAVWNPASGSAAALWFQGDQYRLSTLTAMQRSEIEHSLEIASAVAWAAADAQGAADCLSERGRALLKQINIIEAATYFSEQCGAPNFESEQERANLRDWVRYRAEDIASGKIELCAGTGKDYPAFGIAEHGYNEMSTARVIARRIWRGRGSL